MSSRLACLAASVGLVLAVPAVSWGQNKKCQSASSTNTSRSCQPPAFTTCTPSRTKCQNPSSPSGQRGPNMPNNLRHGNTPQLARALQPTPQMQQMITQNWLRQQTMLNEQISQYRLQDMVKQQLLQYAIEAPTQNLQRELKNSNAFVRWAASVELNRRWRLEKSVAETEARTMRLSVIEASAAAPVTTLPRAIRGETRALVTSTTGDQKLLLQFGIPNAQ